MVIPAKTWTKRVEDRVIALEKRAEVLERVVKKLRAKSWNSLLRSPVVLLWISYYGAS